MSEMTIITNNHWREIIYGCELTSKEQKEFDFLEGDELDMAQFFRYKGDVEYLGNYMRIEGVEDKENPLHGWHGSHGDSYFSGTLVKLHESGDSLLVGRYFS